MRGTKLAIAVALSACTVAACSSAGPSSDTTFAQAPSDAPNVVVILTDDQTLASLSVMPRTNALIADQGTTYSTAVVNFPMCCPSRATYLTGQYASNHGVIDNVAPLGGYSAFDHTNSLAVWMQRAGYETSLVGHYLYEYGLENPEAVPPGWDSWFSTIDPTTFSYNGYTVNQDGALVEYGDEPEDYVTDVMADRAVAEINRLAGQDDPFFVNFWTLAPHVQRPEPTTGFPAVYARPAPRHEFRFEQTPWGRAEAPAFNEVDVSDKPAYVAEQSLMIPVAELTAQFNYRRSLESLLAVDEAVERIMNALRQADVLDETVVVFTSDNGFLQGEHRLRNMKNVPYEESIRVPLLIRGPGFAPGVTDDRLVANTDIAPTILDVAGVAAGLPTDGISLASRADPGADGPDDRAVYIQNGLQLGGLIPHFDGVRVPGWVYVEYDTGELELYDLTADPHQLQNRAGDPALADLESHLRGLLVDLKDCEGDECRAVRFEPPL